jgi:hypothetical protein
MSAVVSPFQQLFDGVDDLIRRVAQTENPEVRRIRARVHARMVAAQSAIESGTQQATIPPALARDKPGGSDSVDPLARAVTALLVGLGVALAASR